jgi:hypothetical protein
MLNNGLGFTYFLILPFVFSWHFRFRLLQQYCINMRFFLYTRLTVLFGAFLLFKLAKDSEIEMVRETEMVR